MLLKCRSLSSVHLCGLPTKNVPLYLCFDIAFPPKMDYTAVCRLCIVRCNNGSQLGVTGHTLSSQGTSANVWRRFSLEHSGGLLPSSGERSEGLLNMQKYRRQSSPPPTISWLIISTEVEKQWKNAIKNTYVPFATHQTMCFLIHRLISTGNRAEIFLYLFHIFGNCGFSEAQHCPTSHDTQNRC